MGKAGRKVQTIELPERPLQISSTHPRNFSVTTRNLCKSNLGGVIFGCKHETKDECLRKQLFGLTSFHYPYVKNVKQGLPLFLFNYSDRKLYGIYEAASHGQMNIDSRAWTEDDTETTQFPAQVRIHVKAQCVPLVEKQYFEILKDNYYTDKYFWFELDHTQTKALITLFKPLPIPNLSSMKDIVPSSRSNQLKTLTNGEPTGAVKRKKNSKPSVAVVSKNKFASLTWDDSCSSDLCNSASEEGETRESDSNQESDLAGENVQESHLDVSPREGANQSSHGSWWETSTGAIEVGQHNEDVSEWGAEYPWKSMQHDSGGSVHLNGENHDFVGTDAVNESEFKGTGFGADWFTYEGAFEELPSCSNNLKPLNNAEWTEVGTGKRKKKSKAPAGSQNANKLASSTWDAGCSRKIHIAELEQNTSSPYLYDENAEWGQIIKVLKETTEALENKQVEADLELQELRNAIKESEKTIDELKAHVKELELTHSIVGMTSNMCAKHSIGSEKVIYLIGGHDGSTCLSSLVSFSPLVDLVKPLKSMSSGRACASAAVLNDNLYVFGGRDCSSSFDTVLCYSTKNDEWTSSPDLSCPKLGLAGATLDGKIYAIGGCYGSTYFSEVEMLDPALGRWISLQPMLQKRFALAAAELHGVLYAVGGFDGRCYLRSVERHDPRVGQWMSLTGMKTSRGWHALAAFNDKIYAIGGHDGTKMLSSVETFEPRVGAWMVGEPLSVARGYSAAAVIDDSIFVIGGKQDGDLDVDAAECYKEETGWSASNFNSIGKMSYLSAVVV